MAPQLQQWQLSQQRVIFCIIKREHLVCLAGDHTQCGWPCRQGWDPASGCGGEDRWQSHSGDFLVRCRGAAAGGRGQPGDFPLYLTTSTKLSWFHALHLTMIAARAYSLLAGRVLCKLKEHFACRKSVVMCSKTAGLGCFF